MKLLNCETRQIEEFFGISIPASYAILSHRWESGEVTYQDLQTPELATKKAGWTKINDLCRIAKKNGYSYAWVDTCCINKQDLTELTEAINSMFKWYANAAITIEATQLTDQSTENTWYISLGCRKASSMSRETMNITLRELGGGVFVRWNADSCDHFVGNDDGLETTFYVMKSVDAEEEAALISRLDMLFHRSFKFHDTKNIVKFESAKPIRNWNARQAMFVTEGLESFVGVVFCTFNDKPLANSLVVACGFEPGDHPWFTMRSAKGAGRRLYKAAEAGNLVLVRQLGLRDQTRGR
ncbi:Vegetative incompatibility protein HET-E-1 [Colletotrichum siamense]|uniref:Vegetative incompatibility protein HET-E-1 n=1 Tax=Colletotrichum siamense TaxID=690259 RepID=A0A9P5KAJ8_COLSI|nr:Vegetative incompatibility protein HET-E-1 [Colletotrichum siamense]KAF4864781.1 Vegetative incompatibility protein HET-E-1 [Colletotrichum siamense]